MATDKGVAPNIDRSDLINFPNGRIKDNDGSGDGTPVNRLIYSDIHEFFAKLMRLAAISYNALPESEGTGYQLVAAAIALAGKNDFITPLNTISIIIGGIATDVISVPLKLSTLKTNEALICKAMFDLTDEALIKGTESATQALTFAAAPFKTGDYIRFIYNNPGVTLVRLADDANLDVLVTELNYLKAATNLQTIAGMIANAAVTPASLKAAFEDWVNGAGSATYLASAMRNGLLSAAQWSIINSIPANPVKNTGWFSGVDAGGGTVGALAPRAGDIVSAQIAGIGGAGDFTVYLVTFINPMANTNYFVRFSIASEGVQAPNDVSVGSPQFRPVSTTTFSFAILQMGLGGVQNLKIHCEVVQF